MYYTFIYYLKNAKNDTYWAEWKSFLVHGLS